MKIQRGAEILSGIGIQTDKTEVTVAEFIHALAEHPELPETYLFFSKVIEMVSAETNARRDYLEAVQKTDDRIEELFRDLDNSNPEYRRKLMKQNIFIPFY